MAKVIWKLASSPDSPIFNVEYVISSRNSLKGYRWLKSSSTLQLKREVAKRGGLPGVDSPGRESTFEILTS